MNINDMGIDELRLAVQTMRPYVDECRLLERKNKELQAIVDKLPKTKDGMPITPGMTVWVLANYGDGLRIHELVVYNLSSVACSDGDRYHWACDQCYSTHEAAEAAAHAAEPRRKEE